MSRIPRDARGVAGTGRSVPDSAPQPESTVAGRPVAPIAAQSDARQPGGFPPAAAPEPELPRGRIVAMFVGLLIAMLVAALNQTIVSTALPTITGELGGVDHMLWITTTYVLVSTIMMPVYGSLGDMVGRKGLFVWALVFFAAGSAVCGWADSMGMLIAGRAVQGLGGGGIMVLSRAIVADVVPPRIRGTYMGIMGMAFVVPTIVGPLLGGFFTDVAGWRWGFWMNLPLAVVAAASVVFTLPSRRVRGAAYGFDVLGTLTMAAALSALVLATSLGGSAIEWQSPELCVLVAVAVVLAIVFVLVERRAKCPIIPLGLFRNRNFVLTALAGLLAMVALMGIVSYLPTFFQIVHGMSATASGFMQLPMTAAGMISSIAAGVLVTKTGRYKKLMVTSFVIMLASVAAMSLIQADTSLVFVGVCLFVLGFGLGLSSEILTLIAQNEFSADIVGTVTAASNFFREVGTTLGASIVGAIFSNGVAAQLARHLEPLGGTAALGVDASSLTPAIVRDLPEQLGQVVQLAYSDAIVPMFATIVPVAAVGVVLMLLLKKTPLAEKVSESGHMGGGAVGRPAGRAGAGASTVPNALGAAGAGLGGAAGRLRAGWPHGGRVRSFARWVKIKPLRMVFDVRNASRRASPRPYT